MVKTLNGRTPLEQGTTIWRYMDLPKYLDLLRTSELHFCPLPQMEDRWEGAVGSLNLNAEIEKLMREHGIDRKFAETVALQNERTGEDERGRAYVNCWHISTHESAAMWNLYAQSNRGIAVKSNWGMLVDSLLSIENLISAPVKYIEHDSDITSFEPEHLCSLKRKSFEHEQELRLMRYDRRDPERPKTPRELEATSQDHIDSPGIRHDIIIDPKLRPHFYRYPINLNSLICEVVVAPDYPEWQVESVRSLSKLYGLNSSIVRSSLERPASYNRYNTIISQ